MMNGLTCKRRLIGNLGLHPAFFDGIVRYLAIFVRWLQVRLRDLAARPSVASTIESYAKWNHLNRLRQLVDTGRNMDIACRNARQAITEAGKFLVWLEDDQGVSVETFGQTHIDSYLDRAVTTRSHIKHFISWFAQGRGGKRRYYVPPRGAKTVPTLSQRERIELIRKVLEFEGATAATRVAALIHLLWATPLTRIVGLTVNDIETRPDGIYLLLGKTPTFVPELVAPLFWDHISNRSNQQTANRDTSWLFPGFRAGRPISVPTLQNSLKKFGLDPQRTRNSTLKHLTAQLDPHTLADTLGYSVVTMARHAGEAGSAFSYYVEAKRLEQSVSEKPRT